MTKVKSVKKDGKGKGDKVRSGGVQKQGIRFNKDFGQHILKNPLIITSMIDKVCLLLYSLASSIFYSIHIISCGLRLLYNQRIQF